MSYIYRDIYICLGPPKSQDGPAWTYPKSLRSLEEYDPLRGTPSQFPIHARSPPTRDPKITRSLEFEQRS
jgi:hypothetical protein